MIELKEFLHKKEFSTENFEEILGSFLEGSSIDNIYKKIISSDIQLERLCTILQDYSDLCKSSFVSSLIKDKEDVNEIIEMIELLAGVMLSLNLIIERKKSPVLTDGFFNK